MKPQMQEEEYLIMSPSNTAKANQNFSYYSPAIKQMITPEDFPQEMYNSHSPIKHNNHINDLVMKISKCKTSPNPNKK
ncbi:MAG: hypothetical protein ACMG6E_05390 [Candidatus Roizmanbacteria bacterium]